MNVNNAHQDHINVLESSYDKMELYSGSKDGIVSVWNVVDVKNEEDENKSDLGLLHISSLQGQGSSVTAITALEPSTYGKTIVYGSSDKSLRICKGAEEGFHQDSFDL